ncbi:hypothetical protein DFJ69_4421 [Thermomonospora umbrina]|uniref:Uncharacterized protein n=2 Tax=Thermomonospora umbrina TaxID=111806 RepID=A0A3D9SY02_9ACTN|nr:hypothetical protein DFJ69_4421 [Thermomonospora umbrina]
MPCPRLLAVAVVAALGLAGATLTVLDMGGPLAGPLTLLFLLTGPGLATWPLLPRLTPPARVIVSGSVSFVVAMTVAQVMLSLDLWSVRGGVAAVMAVCGAIAVTDVVLTRRAALTAEPDEARPGEEDWLFEA